MRHTPRARSQALASGAAAAILAAVLVAPSGTLAPGTARAGSTAHHTAACEPGASSHGHDHDHGVCAASGGIIDGGPWRAEPEPDEVWLNTHCKARASETTAPHVVTPVFVFNAYTGSSTPFWEKKMREEIYSADRAIRESDLTWTQHLRVACTTDANGNWLNIWTPSLPIYNLNGDTVVDCGDILENVRPHFPQGDRRYIYFIDRKLDPTQLDSCSRGGIDVSDSRPGIQNNANSVYGWAQIDPDNWYADGSSEVSTSLTLQELFHSFGLVGNAPGGDGGSHTKDYPDTMNAGRYIPGTATGLGQNCSAWNSVKNMTHEDSFLDCGRDSYWTIKARSGDYLCKNFNLATDSLYLYPRPEREPECL